VHSNTTTDTPLSTLAGGTASDSQTIIEFRDVHKAFGETAVLRGIDLNIERGSVVVICGPSGSGKSTLLRLINRLEILDSGSILVNNVNIHKASKTELRSARTRIGFVFQQFNLYPHMSARENITLSLRKLLKLDKQTADRRADELLASVGLADKALSLPHELSGGQQQRVAIARSLAMDPEILLFDEPTSALDPEMIGEVLTVIKQLSHRGITLVVVTHEMGFAREVADRVVFIDEGKVVEHATPVDFFEHTQSARAQQFLRRLLSPLRVADV